MANIISVINMKGGVGKTTISIGIADYLADQNKKVLIIDIDPQFNATQALLDKYRDVPYEDETKNFYTEEIKKNMRTIYKLFKPMTSLREEERVLNSEDLITNLKKNLDIICGDLDLVLVNKSSDHANVRRLSNFIEDNNLRERYDFIIIDCPPTLTVYTDSALMASDYYLIPNRIDRYSMVGIDSLQEAVKTLIYQERIKLKCIGLVYTMLDKTLTQKQQKIKTNFEAKETVSAIDIFASNMGIVKHIQYGESGSVPTCYKASREDIEAISLELIEKINNYSEE